MRSMTDEDPPEVPTVPSRIVPHPTPLREATFSHKWEKEGARAHFPKSPPPLTLRERTTVYIAA